LGRGADQEAAMGEFSPWHLLIVVAAFLLLFGAHKLPQMARSVGQSMRIFKAEIGAVSGESKPEQRPAPASSLPATESSPAHRQES
jgi:sec-independent protein translocase protein TatA